MPTPEPEVYDVAGIGFGPSNLSLAVALEENPQELQAAFFDRQPRLSWHPGMLVPTAKMQVAFLKDLASFRNPLSKFSFVAYLHDVGRLARFVNNGDFFPTRREFHDYLEWAEARLDHQVGYNCEVTGIGLPPNRGPGPADKVQIELRDPTRPGPVRLIQARNVVISTGLAPRMPAGVESDDFVWHSSQFLLKFGRSNPRKLRRVAVVGAGQSAAEIARFLYDTLPDAEIFSIMPSYGYSIADNTPFANQVFDPGAVDDYYQGSVLAKEAIWRYHRNTNYSVVDDEVIRGLYQRAYEDTLNKRERLHFISLARIIDVKRVAEDTRITVHSVAGQDSFDLDVDILVCATGYNAMDPALLLGELKDYCRFDVAGRFQVERDYRLATTPDLDCGIYLQGGTEHTHGLSSSLLSNIAVRSGEIVDSILTRRTSREKNGVRT